MARAKPTRRRIPPESSEGAFPRCREPHEGEALGDARAHLLRGSSSCAASAGRRCSRRRSSSRRGLPPGTTSRSADGSRRAATREALHRSSPSTSTVPASGVRSPIMCLRRTLFPIPDLPRMTIDSPLAIVRSSPSRTTFGPKRLREARQPDLGKRLRNRARRGRAQKSTFVRKKSETRIASDAEDDGRRRRAAHPFRAARRVEALLAADERQEEAEDGRLDEARPEVVQVEELERVLDVDDRVRAEQPDRDEVAARDPEGVREDDEHRDDDDPRQDPAGRRGTGPGRSRGRRGRRSAPSPASTRSRRPSRSPTCPVTIRPVRTGASSRSIESATTEPTHASAWNRLNPS